MSRTTALLRSRTGVRIAAVTGAAVLCSGLAVPALAHDATGKTATTHHDQLSFAERRGHALHLLAGEARWLNGLKAKVAGDDRLTADQRAAFTDHLDAALQQVRAARAAVQAADTSAELRAALDRAELPALEYPKYVLPTLAQVKSAALQLLGARADRLAALRDKVSGDDRLSAEQRSRFVAKLDAALARIAKAKDAVAAAGTRADVRAALASVAPWPVRYPRHHRVADPGAATVKLAGAHRSVTVRRASDPAHRCDGHWGARDGARDTRWGGHPDWHWGYHRSGSWDGGDRSGSWDGGDRSGSWDGGDRSSSWGDGDRSGGSWS